MAVTAAAVLLAAGSGSRFESDTPKLLADLDGKPLIRWAIESVLASGLPGPYLVTGPIDLGDAAHGAKVVVNERWAEGMASSLRAGVRAAAADGHDAVVVALGDQPGIAPDAWRAVAAATATPIAVATYPTSVAETARQAGGDGDPAGTAMSACAKSRRYGHPVRLHREIWDDLPLSGEDGARNLMRERPDLVTEVPCNSGTATDIDTAEELDRFNSPTRSG